MWIKNKQILQGNWRENVSSLQWFCLFSEIVAPQILKPWLLCNAIKVCDCHCSFAILFYFYFIQRLWLFLIGGLHLEQLPCVYYLVAVVSRFPFKYVWHSFCRLMIIYLSADIMKCTFYCFICGPKIYSPNCRPFQWLWGRASLHVQLFIFLSITL